MPHVMRYVVIALLVAALAGGVLLAVRGCAPGAASLEGGGTAVTGVNAQMTFCALGDAFVAFDGTYARAYDGRTAELLWERSPDQSDGYSCASSDWLLALYKTNSLYVYDTAGNVAFSVSPQKEIARVSAGHSRVAVQYADDTIEVIDSTGKSVETLTPSDGTLVDFALYSSSDLLYVLMLDASGILPRSVLNIYQPGKLLMAGYSTTDQLYYRALMSGSSVYIVGTRTVDGRSTSDTTETSVPIYGWTLCDACAGDELHMLFTLSSQQENPTALRVLTGTQTQDLHMPAGCTDLCMGTRSVYGFAGQTVYSVPLAGGATSVSSLPYAVEDVLCRLNNNRVLLSSADQVYLVTLP